MNMIRHNDKFIQFDMWKKIGNVQSIFIYNLSEFIQHHFSIYDFTKNTFPIMRAYCYKIRIHL